MIESEIIGQSNGAQFRRADLHIHSYGPGGSYDVTDTAMTPEAIVDRALAENLQVIAIADHNVIGNIRAAIAHASGKPILVVPAVELSTLQGHMLIYCPTIEAMEGFYGKLAISTDKKFCSHTIDQCLAFAADYEGFGICAHIELSSGLEGAHPKFDAFKQAIFNSKNLLALEVSKSENVEWFTHADTHADRKNCAVLRCKHLLLEDDIELPKVMSSDAHTLEALGKNASGNRRLTRIKMETLTFDALRIALMDGAARVRLEDLIPEMVPRFVGMKLEGGFLRDQLIHFSPNLTCIIGGRGAGKSTMLESLRACSGNQVTSSLLDSEVWPDAITLLYEDETGSRHTLSRSKLNTVVNANSDGPTLISLESYGQGETAETIQHCDRDPAILLSFLDGFIDLRALSERDEELRQELLDNQTTLERLALDLKAIPDFEKAKKIADDQVATLKTQKAKEVVELEQKLATEKQFRTELLANLDELLNSLKEGLSSEDLRNLISGIDGDELAVGKDEFEAIRSVVETLTGNFESQADVLVKMVASGLEEIRAGLKAWAAKEQLTRAKIEELRRELEKQKIKLDMAYIRKITKDAADFAKKLEDLRKSVPKHRAAADARKVLVAERRNLKRKIANARQAFAILMTKNLAATVVDYRVTIRFREGALSPELEELIKTAMGWRTSQVPRTRLIVENVTPFELLDAVEKGNPAVLEAITDSKKNQIFSSPEAQEILVKLKEANVVPAIQRCVFEDLPEIIVARTVPKPEGGVATIIRQFSQLSLGQQQSILLSILLFSKSRAPLIIDQPEDNLDSEFIYKTLVRSLRLIKESRQVIIVTHNANIAVLGDAELIVPLRGASDRSVVRDRGSIDNGSTKELVCTILEGSKKAFMRRQEVYGY
jgi:DNA repair ATPase RecN